jgi:hypothetical protein
MPFDPSSPFDPNDPWQWWQTRILPHLVQPNAPPNAARGQAPNLTSLSNGSLVPPGALEDDGFPNDWIYPDSQNAPVPATAPPTAPPAPNPQPNPAASNRPPARFDPYAAYWAQIPASRVGAMAWHPPIFLSPDSFAPQDTPSSARGGPPARFSNPLAQFLPAASALPTLPPDFGAGGILGGIAKLAAEQARANDPWALPENGILGGIAKLQTNSPFPYEPSLPKVTNDPSDGADAFRAPQATPNGLIDPSVPPGLPEGFRTLAGFSADRSILDEGPAATNAAYYPNPLDQILPCFVSNIGCVGGGGGNRGGGGDGPVGPRPPPLSAPRGPAPEPRTSSLSTSGTAAPAEPPAPPTQLPAPTSAPQPPPRPSPPPPAAPPPAAPPPTSPGQAATSSRPSGRPTALESVVPPNQDSTGGGSPPNLPPGIGPGPFAGEPIPAGPGKRPSPAQQDQINASGNKYGCHTRGAPEPGTRSGNWIGDHQISTALNPAGQQQYYLPHCWSCSPRQGGLLRSLIQRRGK